LTGSDLVTHGAPVFFGLVFFFYVTFSRTVRAWAQEVVAEVSKVVWPSQKDTSAMTIFVCFFMIMTGILLGVFDLISSQVIQFIIELR
jgi:preprotein translocase subunit SecE